MKGGASAPKAPPGSAPAWVLPTNPACCSEGLYFSWNPIEGEFIVFTLKVIHLAMITPSWGRGCTSTPPFDALATKFDHQTISLIALKPFVARSVWSPLLQAS